MHLNPTRHATRALRTLALCGLLGTAAAQAGTVSYRGQFTADDDLFVTQFVLPGAALFSAATLGYGGGTDADGHAVAPGGFAPVLALFMDGFGLVQLARGSSQSCGPGAGQADPLSGFCWDAGFSLQLGAGSYSLALSQDGNEPLGLELADGYTQTGQPDYTGLAYLGQPGARFIQVDGTQRSGFWALDLTTTATEVPEPGSWQLALLGAAAIALSRRPNRTRTTA